MRPPTVPRRRLNLFLLFRLHRLGFAVGHEVIDGQKVTVKTQAGDDADASGGGHGFMPKFFALINIRNMYFNGAEAAARDAIAQRHAHVGVATWIDDQEFHTVVSPLRNGVDDFAFVIGLKEAGLNAGFFSVCRDFLFEIGKGLGAINLRLAFTESVEVGSVDNANFHMQTNKCLPRGGKSQWLAVGRFT